MHLSCEVQVWYKALSHFNQLGRELAYEEDKDRLIQIHKYAENSGKGPEGDGNQILNGDECMNATEGIGMKGAKISEFNRQAGNRNQVTSGGTRESQTGYCAQ